VLDKKKLIIKTIEDKLASDIKVIDFNNVSPFYDYFIICTSLNDRMNRSICKNVEKTAKENNIIINSIEVSNDGGWSLIDLDDIVIHVFSKQQRELYALESLWKDLPIEEIHE